ncbi:hypothetical protein K8I61_13830 [bacterium]|nr:hypothetical protein [bacterium]
MKRKMLALALVFVFGVATAAMAGPFDKLKGAADLAKVPTATENSLKLSDVNPALASYEGGPFDISTGGAFKYNTWGDATWDSIAKDAATAQLGLAFAEKVSATETATKEDLDAATKALEPTKNLAALQGKITTFIGSVKSDPKKAVILKDAEKVAGQVKSAVTKAATVAQQVAAKAAAVVAAGEVPAM